MKNNIVKIFLFALLFRLVLAPLVWHIDVFNHLDWGQRFFEYGPAKFYSPEANVWNFTWPNQPPGAMYIFASSYILFNSIFSVLWFINTHISVFPSILVTLAESKLYIIVVKLPAILSDLGIAYLIYKILPKKYSTLGAVVYLFNPVVWYNSAVWGQTDATINFFVLLSFYMLLKKKINFSVLAFAISLYIKVSLIIFSPFYIIYLLRSNNYKKLFKPVVFSLIIILISTLPFMNKYTPDPFSFLRYVYLKKVLVDQMQVITANAFNFWGATTGLELVSHDNILFVFSYKTWGYILALVAIIPALYSVYKKHDEKTLIWSLAITAFSIFMLFTNMHERYIYPLFPYLTILAVQNRRLVYVYIAVSVIALLNMYNLWWVPEINFVKNILENMFVLRVLSFLNLLIFVYFYKYWLQSLNNK